MNHRSPAAMVVWHNSWAEKERYSNIPPEEIHRLLEQKREWFNRNHAHLGWKSWNAADARNGGFNSGE